MSPHNDGLVDPEITERTEPHTPGPARSQRVPPTRPSWVGRPSHLLRLPGYLAWSFVIFLAWVLSDTRHGTVLAGIVQDFPWFEWAGLVPISYGIVCLAFVASETRVAGRSVRLPGKALFGACVLILGLGIQLMMSAGRLYYWFLEREWPTDTILQVIQHPAWSGVVAGSILLGLAGILGIAVNTWYTRYEAWADDPDPSRWELRTRRNFLGGRHDIIKLYRVLDVSLRQPLHHRLVGIGNVAVISMDRTDPVLLMPGIRRAFEVKRMIADYKAAARQKVGVRPIEGAPSFSGEI